MPVISSLKPKVTREEAVAAFQPRGPAGLVQNLVAGPLRSIAAIYVPFRLFRVTIGSGLRRDERLLAIEAVRGSLDLYGFDHLPGPSELLRVETRNCLPPALTDHLAAELLKEKLHRIIFRRGFFRVRGLRAETVPLSLDLHVPYWVGFRGHGKRAQLVVLDAVRRRPEGAKARDLLRRWLLSD